MAFFRRESAAPPAPHPNPEGGRTWYHGTAEPEFYGYGGEGDTEAPPSTPDRYETEYFEHGKKHWNSDLGSHWTSVPETARYFANHHSNGPSSGSGRIAHAYLHMGSPKHYDSEFDLAAEAVHWAKTNGYRHLPDSPDARSTFAAGHRFDFASGHHVDLDEGAMDHWNSPTRAGRGRTEQVDYSNHPEIGLGNDEIRRAIKKIDEEPEESGPQDLRHHAGYLDSYISGHPFRHEIVQGFKKHLMDSGHDGITYGNEYEPPNGHICAIPFHDEHINMHKWEPIAEHDKKNYQRPDEEVEGQQALVSPSWMPGPGAYWETHDGKVAAKQADPDTEEILRMLGVSKGAHWPGRLHTLAEETGAARHLPTPSAENPPRKGYFPGEDLSGIDKAPKVGWVRTERLIPLREYDRAGRDANPDSHETISRIRETMRKSGMTDPVILSHDPHSDRAYLCEGNHRLAAAIREGWPAVPVHVVRAYRSEAEKMGHKNYLGAHKVMPDEYGYTPGNLHPRDVVPDEWLYHRDAGLRPKNSAYAKPEYDAEADYGTNRQRRDDWRSHIRRGLSTGSISNDEAIANGYTGEGHDSGPDTVFGKRTLGWKPLPERLYHVTTDLKGVLGHGLRSRDELGQGSGKGLGGGESDTISFTDDHELAKSILHSMREFHDVVNGRKTIAHMMDEARSGEGAARPFHEDLAGHYKSHWGGTDALEKGLHIQSTTPLSGGVEPPEPGMTPWEGGDHIETPKGTYHTHWVRPMTEDEKRDHAVRFYKTFSAHREWAGGRPDPVFFSTDTDGFRKMDPDNFGIVHAQPKPGAQGYRVPGMGEWRTASGDAVDIVHHQKTAERIDYARNRERAADFGSRFGQDIEPHGRYMVQREPGDNYPDDRWEKGSVEFSNPLHIDFGGGYQEPDNWKRVLSDRYDGKTGADLSDALRAVGHDAIITHDSDGSTREIVDLTHRKISRWLPHDRIFGPGKGGLDPRLFDPRTKRMLPHVADVILGDLHGYWAKTYPDWRLWTRVYLAGSEASEWWGNNDLDTLLGIDHKRLRKEHPEFDSMLDDEIDAYLTKGLKEHLNDEHWTAPWDGQVWHRTYYVNPDSWDIRKIKPYAAYDITRHRWIVEPVHPASDWGPEKLPSAFWDEGEAIIKEINAVLAMPEPYRTGRGAALFDYLHGDRRRAFSDHGTGVYDPGNAVWKYLDIHPDRPLAALLELKRKYEDQQAQEATA